MNERIRKRDVNVIISTRVAYCKKYENGGFTQQEVADMFGISLTTFHTHWERYKKGESLENRSTRPKTSPNKTAKHIEDNIIRIRIRTGFDHKRTAYEYNLAHEKNIKPSLVKKIFKRRGIYEMKNKIKKKKVKLYVKSTPGENVQVDIKYTPKINENGYLVNYYQFTAIDDCTRIRFTSFYEAMSKANAMNFIKNAFLFFPFKVQCIQTDHGTQFTNDFMPNRKKLHDFTALLISEYEVRHKLIPIGHPQSNGKVERSHKTDDTDFYNINAFCSLNDFQIKGAKFLKYYNERRPHQGLGMNMRTPLEKLRSFEFFKNVTLDYSLCHGDNINMHNYLSVTRIKDILIV
jgi:transposase InsO family protein